MKATAYYSSPLGLIKIALHDGQVVALRFAEILEDDIQNEHLLAPLFQQLYVYFKGEQVQFPFALAPAGTPFQQSVWQAVLAIPYGRTRSYEDIAISLGARKKIRAVANAIGKNPIPIIIPCHRVLGKNGDLTGYLGGLWRKQHLLELEKLQTQPPLIPLVATPTGHH